MNWFQQVADRTIFGVATALGLERVDRSHLGPCLVCGSTQRSRTDRRKGPLYAVHGGRGWKCGACDAKGNVLQLVQLRLYHQTLSRGDARWRDLHAWCAGQGWCEGQGATWVVPPLPPEPEPVERQVSRQEVRDLLGQCVPVDRDGDAIGWFHARRLRPVPGVVVLPKDASCPGWATFRGRTWAQAGYRLLFPVFDAHGVLSSVRARSVDLDPAGPKALPPVGFSLRGLVLANQAAQLSMGTSGRRDKLVIAEGEPQWLAWAAARPDLPVVGVVAGSWPRAASGFLLAQLVAPGANVLVCTDHDETGDRYFDTITATFQGRANVRRWKPEVARAS